MKPHAVPQQSEWHAVGPLQNNAWEAHQWHPVEGPFRRVLWRHRRKYDDDRCHDSLEKQLMEARQLFGLLPGSPVEDNGRRQL